MTDSAATPHQQAPDVQMIPLAELRPSPFQPRGREGGRADPALVASVKEHGIIEPLVVRDPAGTRLCFQLMAGHRRLDAARRAKLEHVPCVVREATDAEAAAIVHAENAHRRDLSPVESAAIVASALAAHGGNVTRAARALGLSRQAVLRRARLSHLSPAWRAAAADEVSVVAGWGAAHLEAVARLPEESQEALYRQLAMDGLPARPTVEDVERLTTAALHLLSDAPWPLGDKELLPQAGACLTCPKRSSASPGLFADLDAVNAKPDRCLDGACWDRKGDAWVVRLAENGVNRGEPLVLLRTRAYVKGVTGNPALTDQAQDAGAWEEMAIGESEEQGLYVDGPRRGQTAWVRRRAPAAQGSLDATPAADASPPRLGRPTKAEAARRREIDERCEALMAMCETATLTELPALVDLAALLTIADGTCALAGDALSTAARAIGTTTTIQGVIWATALRRLLPHARAIGDRDQRLVYCEALAAMIGGGE